MNTRNNIITVILFLFCIGSVKVIYDQNQSLQYKDQNINAIQDSVRVYKTRAGEIGYEKLSLQSSIQELEKLNKELYNELEKEKNDVKVITKIEYIVKMDTVFMLKPSVSYSNLSENYRIDFDSQISHASGDQYIAGYTEFKFDTVNYKVYDAIASITSNTLTMDIVTGIRENKDGLPTIFVKTDFPNVTFNSINGAVIDYENKISPKRWGLGVHTGWGVSKYGTHPYIGIGVSYTPIQFNIK